MSSTPPFQTLMALNTFITLSCARFNALSAIEAMISVGSRVIIAKHRATVRYVGPVEGHEGIWVGVEWDDASRGKHDGEVGDKRYFSCSSGAAAPASFVRINKVSPGTTLVEALVLRYTNQLAEGQASTADAQQAYVSTASNKKLWVELVGQEQVTARQSKLELLTSARLVGANVSSVGPPGKLAATAPSLRQLDLTDNLISSCSTLVQICQELPQLQLLNLSRNLLQLPHSLPDTGLQQLQELQCLVLNQCHITWQQVAVLQSCLPNLQELHVAGNNISSLYVQQEPATQQEHQQHLRLVGFESLQVLGLEDNSISSWQEVLRLAGLPKLQRLALSGNPLNSISYPHTCISPAALFSDGLPGLDSRPDEQQGAAAAAASPAAQSSSGPQHEQQRQGHSQAEAGQAGQPGAAQQPFAELQALLLGDCRINSWADVDALNSFPALRELRLSGNPLFDVNGCGAKAGRRFEVIGRVSGLTLLNGADVKPRERRDCELRYLHNVLAEQPEGQAGPEQQQQHPRLAELKAKYGQSSAVAAANPSKQQGSSLNSSTCELMLRCGSTTAKKKLPKSVTVAALRLLCGRLFKLAPGQVQLQLQCPEDGSSPPAEAGSEQGWQDIGQDDTKQLSYWDVTDGCVVLVSCIDPDQQRQQREVEQQAQQQAHEQRMAAQLQQGEALRSAAET